MATILIADDDVNIRELLKTILENGGFSVREAVDGRDALSKIEGCDCAVIDIMMPNMDGYELCSYLRKYYENLPMLMLTAKAELNAKIRGFEIGADDYLTKPFEGDELLMRIKALLRRFKIESSQLIQIGNLQVDRNRFTVSINGVAEDIPRKEFELLFKLAGFPGRTFSRDVLIESVWGHDFDGNERTLDVHIGRLRDRFPEEVYGFKITTVRGLGYRLEVSA